MATRGRPRSAAPRGRYITIRISDDWVTRLGAHMARMQAVRPWPRVTRTAAVYDLLERALALVEEAEVRS